MCGDSTIKAASTGVLLIGGEGPDRGRVRGLIEDCELIVAADSGLDLADRLGLRPDMVVGDMDSIADRGRLSDFPADKVRIYPHDKSETDTEIGLRLLREWGFERVMLIGGGEGRLDHLLGILVLFDREFYPSIWLTAREHIEIIEDSACYAAFPGQTYSFFPIGGPATGLTSNGLKWPLTGLNWKRGDAGISNEATGDSVSVTVTRGKLMMIRSFSEGK